MIYTPATKNAMFFCWLAHKDQTDTSGCPYIFHPIHLAEQMNDEDTTVTALLHDVVEDSDMTLDDLRNAGFNDRVLTAVSLLTRKEGTPYMEYIQALKSNPIARVVKMADLQHNCDMTRLDKDSITLRDSLRFGKYLRAISVLSE